MAPAFGCILLDIQVAGQRLPMLLARQSALIRRALLPLDIALVAPSPSAELDELAHRFGTRVVIGGTGPLGGRLNAAAAQLRPKVLIVTLEREAIREGWLRRAYFEVLQGRYDACLQRPPPRGLLQWLLTTHPAGAGTRALSVSQEWFDRLGGFDPDLDETALTDLATRLRSCQARILSPPRCGSLFHHARTSPQQR